MDKKTTHAAGLPEMVAALCQVLHTAFGWDVWPEEAKQGFHEPCFFVRSLTSSQQRAGLYRCKRVQSFVVQYYPEGEDTNMALLDMVEKLYRLLEYVHAPGGLYRGFNMRHTTAGGALQFFVDYNPHLLDIPHVPVMERIERHKQGVK